MDSLQKEGFPKKTSLRTQKTIRRIGRFFGSQPGIEDIGSRVEQPFDVLPCKTTNPNDIDQKGETRNMIIGNKTRHNMRPNQKSEKMQINTTNKQIGLLVVLNIYAWRIAT